MNESSDLALGRQVIAKRLPEPWFVRAGSRKRTEPARFVPDAVWVVAGPAGARETVLVERRTQVTLKQVRDLGVLADAVASGAAWLDDTSATLLLSAPWLSGPVREALDKARVSYVDDTGNINFRLRKLPVLIRDMGAATNPRPRSSTQVRLSGEQALAVVRYLADVRPPYSQSEIVSATGVSAGYVSKLVSRLADIDLVERTPAAIRDVDWAELLRQRAQQAPPLLAAGRFVPMLARRGLAATLEGLNRLAPDPNTPNSQPWGWVTGSAAANRFAPTAPTVQLAVWVSDLKEVRRRLGLLPTNGSPDVVLLPITPASVARAQQVDGLPMVAMSQLVLDCLGGNGRLPAEGEAVLEWMKSNELKWRHRSGVESWAPSSVSLGGPSSLAPSRDEPKGWTRETLEAVLKRLSATAPIQVDVINEAALGGGFVSRERVYEIAGYDLNRSLRGFTRPVNRIQRALVDQRVLDASAPPLLEPVYDPAGSPRVQGFRVPHPIGKLISVERVPGMDTSPSHAGRGNRADGQ